MTVHFRTRPRSYLASTRNDTQRRIGQSYSTTRHRTSAPIRPLRNHRRPSKPLREFISSPIPEKADTASCSTCVDQARSRPLDARRPRRFTHWHLVRRKSPSTFGPSNWCRRSIVEDIAQENRLKLPGLSYCSRSSRFLTSLVSAVALSLGGHCWECSCTIGSLLERAGRSFRHIL